MFDSASAGRGSAGVFCLFVCLNLFFDYDYLSLMCDFTTHISLNYTNSAHYWTLLINNHRREKGA